MSLKDGRTVPCVLWISAVGLAEIPLGSEAEFRGVLHMNGTTRDILEILKNDVTENEIVALMEQQYDASEEDIRRSVQKVLGTLQENHLLDETAAQ